jgi:hypothetical protein
MWGSSHRIFSQLADLREELVNEFHCSLHLRLGPCREDLRRGGHLVHCASDAVMHALDVRCLQERHVDVIALGDRGATDALQITFQILPPVVAEVILVNTSLHWIRDINISNVKVAGSGRPRGARGHSRPRDAMPSGGGRRPLRSRRYGRAHIGGARPGRVTSHRHFDRLFTPREHNADRIDELMSHIFFRCELKSHKQTFDELKSHI